MPRQNRRTWFFLRKTPRKKTVLNNHYIKHKEAAREIVTSRVIFWNQIYNFKYNRIAIKNQKSRWGSCSSLQNLNFNYKLVFLPAELLDYIVVHELCHLKELNHGHNFWREVEKTIPDYRNRILLLREFERRFLELKREEPLTIHDFIQNNATKLERL